MEGDVSSAVEPLHLITHVFEEQLVLVQVHLQPSSEQTEQKLHPGRGDDSLQTRVTGSSGQEDVPWKVRLTAFASRPQVSSHLSFVVHHVPDDLEMPQVVVAEQLVLLGGVEQGEVLHDDGCGSRRWY